VHGIRVDDILHGRSDCTFGTAMMLPHVGLYDSTSVMTCVACCRAQSKALKGALTAQHTNDLRKAVTGSE